MIEWVYNTAKFSNGYIGKLGKFPVFKINWNANRPKGGDEPSNILTTTLPGLKSALMKHDDRDELKEFAEKVLAHWLNCTGLKNG